MTKQVPNDEIQYHIGLSKNMIEGAEYVLLPGDPYRVESLAKSFDPHAKHLASSQTLPLIKTPKVTLMMY